MTESDLAQQIRGLAIGARTASRPLSRASRAQKDAVLLGVASRLRSQAAKILAANEVDVAAFREKPNASGAFVDRLTLNAVRLEGVAKAVEEIARQDDPVGENTGMKRRPNGLLIGQVRIPLGVIAIVYESRPNVTIDAAALCIKSGNAVLLRGGSEAAHTNAELGAILKDSLREAGLPPDAVQIVPPGDRDAIRVLVGLTGLVDLAIPRGGEGLVRFVTEHARVPVIQHYQGVCHLYVDEEAEVEASLKLVVDGKLVRPAVCNALECLLVHDRQASTLLPALGALAKERALELRACARSLRFLPNAVPATEEDYGREFSDKILAVKIVDGLDEALRHVERYGSGHTEAICTPNYESAQRWLHEVDASCVLVNASTRFNDGGELGLGAEIGISTSKLHAFGPMGVESLTSRKWVVYGQGQVRG